MSAPEPLLELEGLRVERGGTAVLALDTFRVMPRETVALIGPNGSGKTTLLLSLLGLLPRTAGRIRWRGKEAATAGDRLALRRRLSLVQQEPLLFDTTVAENVASGLRIRRTPRSELQARVAECLERFRLGAMAGRAARKLSGGEARRVSLARAVAVRPELLLLDEPFANLDAPTRAALTADLERAVHEEGIALLLVTHDRGEALRLGDRMVVLQGGRIVQSASPTEVMNHPADEFVAACVGCDTILPGSIELSEHDRLVVAVHGLRRIEAIGAGPPGGRVLCCIRPENVVLEANDPQDQTSARNVFRARVASVESLGPFFRVRLDCGFELASYVTPESYTTLGLREGREVFASFKATSVHVIHRGPVEPAS